jgi:hypothetical protein
MKHIALFSFIFLLFNLSISAQSVKKYILLEQFSNTNCSNCANRIPQFRNNLQGFEGDYHLISFFAPTPYPSCFLYNANKPQNDVRRMFYNVLGTPTIHVNGLRVNQGTSIVPVSVLEDLAAETSPVEVVVSKEENGNSMNVNVSVITHGDLPVFPGGGNYVLQVIAVETLVVGGPLAHYQNHHNVFRTMITPDAGTSFVPANPGEELAFSFSFEPESTWNADSLVIIAFVQETESQNVLNSGSNLDPVSTSVNEIETLNFSISPNPANEFLRISSGFNLTTLDFEIFDGNARILKSGRFTGEVIDISKFPAGQYYIAIRSGAKSGIMPFVKTN